MKITIFNLMGSETPEVEKVVNLYQKDFPQAAVQVQEVDAKPLKDCIGCWSCWVKTPGRCVHKDMEFVYGELMSSDRVLLMLPIRQGFIEGSAKSFIDRLIPIYHPYITLYEGEMMHVERYASYPKFEFYFDSASLSKEEEAVVEDYVFRTSHHFRETGVRVFETEGKWSRKTLAARAAKEDLPWETQTLKKGKYIVYNGSPRGKKGNSLKVANQIILGLKAAGVQEADIELRHLVEKAKHIEWAKTFNDHSHHLFVFPLYVHSMPGIVKQYLDLIEGVEASEAIKPLMSYFIQSGFSGANQSFYLRAYMARVPKRLGCLYGGTVVRGGMEALQVQPDEANKKLYAKLQALGKGYAESGRFKESDAAALESRPFMAGWVQVVFKLLEPTGIMNVYWDMQLKKNGVFKERFDRPYGQSLE